MSYVARYLETLYTENVLQFLKLLGTFQKLQIKYWFDFNSEGKSISVHFEPELGEPDLLIFALYTIRVSSF